jgi:hypothetical protein
MEWSRWRRPLFTMLMVATVLIGGCSEMATAPTVEQQGLSLSRVTDFDSTLAWDWNRVSPATGQEYCDPQQIIYPPECCFQYPWHPSCSPPTPQCDGESNAMAAEYENPLYENSLRPYCFDFTTSGGTANFSWQELNGHGYLSSPPYGNPHYDNGAWGLIQSSLTTGLENTRSIYNRGGVALSGAYRCPHGNRAIGGVPNSFHTHGRAADMYSADHGGKQWTLEECTLLRQAVLQTNPILDEVLACDYYTDRHLHAAW